MFKKILLPLDGFEPAGLSEQWVKHLTPQKRAEIVLLRVIDTSLLRPDMVSPMFRLAEAQLQQVERDLNFSGLPCKMLVRSGKAAPSIIREAQEEAADLVVLAAHRDPTASSRGPGGVATGVARQCSIPVLLLHSNLKPPSPDRVRRLVVPLDHMVEETVAWAVKFAKTHHAQVIFLALQARRRRGSSPGPDERLEELRVRLMNTCSDLRASGVKVILRVLRGDPSTCALGSVAENDLLLVTAPCHQDLERILLRSIEERVLVRSEVPVIILKERDDSPDPSARRARSG